MSKHDEPVLHAEDVARRRPLEERLREYATAQRGTVADIGRVIEQLEEERDAALARIEATLGILGDPQHPRYENSALTERIEKAVLTLDNASTEPQAWRHGAPTAA